MKDKEEIADYFKDVSKEDYEKDLLLLKNIEHTFWDYYTNKN